MSCSQLRVVVYGLAAFWIFTISSAIAFAFLAFNINKSILIFIDINIMLFNQTISCWAFSADADAGGGRRPINTTTASATLPRSFRAASADFGCWQTDGRPAIDDVICQKLPQDFRGTSASSANTYDSLPRAFRRTSASSALRYC